MEQINPIDILNKDKTKLLKGIRITLIVFIIIWIFVIYKFSSDTGIQSGNLSSTVSDIFNRLIELATQKNLKEILSPYNYSIFELIIRKLAHMFVFMVLSLSFMLLLFTFKLNMFFKVFIALALSFGYACFDEFHQTLVSGRVGSFRDVLIDTTGAVFGVLLAIVIFCIIYTIYHRFKLKELSKLEKQKKEVAS